MDIIDSKNDTELLQSLIAETAKATNELKTAQNDIDKAKSRIKFALMLANKMIDRKKD